MKTREIEKKRGKKKRVKFVEMWEGVELEMSAGNGCLAMRGKRSEARGSE